MDLHIAHSVSDASHVGEVRRSALTLASNLGFSASDAGRVGLAATEAATNIVKHAGRGEILLRRASELADCPGVELIALDQGPGMSDVDRCMADGFSTAGSLGTGLGALSRLAAEMEIYSAASKGTTLLVRVLPHAARPRPVPAGFAVGVVGVAKSGESVSGDAWSSFVNGSIARFMLVDGLGHGPAAEVAASAAVRAFEGAVHESLPEVFSAMHGALLPTRGAAVSITEISSTAEAGVHFAGVGNIAGFLAWSGGVRHMVGQNGTLGVQLGRLRIASYAWPAHGLLVMHSDGLKTHVAIEGYPGLTRHSPTVVAAVLYRDFARGTDDATVLVAKAVR